MASGQTEPGKGQPGKGKFSVSETEPLRVMRIELEDKGQDFLELFVLDETVIDCRPFQGRVWVGQRCFASDDPDREGDVLIGADPESLKVLNYKATRVTLLDRDETTELLAKFQDWVLRYGQPDPTKIVERFCEETVPVIRVTRETTEDPALVFEIKDDEEGVGSIQAGIADWIGPVLTWDIGEHYVIQRDYMTRSAFDAMGEFEGF